MKTWKVVATLLGVVGLAFGTIVAAGVSRASSPSASASAPPPPPVLRGADVPTDTSDPPKPAEWRDARAISINRGKPGPCKALFLREWLRVECKNFVGVSLIAGEPKNSRTWVSGYPNGWDSKTNTTVTSTAIFEAPLSRGRSSIVTFLTVESDYGGDTDGEGPTLHISWRAGAADPVLIMTDPHPNADP